MPFQPESEFIDRLEVMNSEHKVYPYLLRGVEIVEPNQAWSTDTTYIPMHAGEDLMSSSRWG